MTLFRHNGQEGLPESGHSGPLPCNTVVAGEHGGKEAAAAMSRCSIFFVACDLKMCVSLLTIFVCVLKNVVYVLKIVACVLNICVCLLNFCACLLKICVHLAGRQEDRDRDAGIKIHFGAG